MNSETGGIFFCPFSTRFYFANSRCQSSTKNLQALERYGGWSSLWIHWFRKKCLLVQAAALERCAWRSQWLQRSGVLVLAQEQKLCSVYQNFSKHGFKFVPWDRLTLTHLHFGSTLIHKVGNCVQKATHQNLCRCLDDQLSSREQILCPRCLTLLCLSDMHLTLEPTRIFR